MMAIHLAPWALAPNDAFTWILKLLAVVGGAVAGAILANMLAWGLARIISARPLPGGAKLFVRLLGAVAGGYIAFQLVGGITGFGLGGGSNGDGDGKDDGKNEKKDNQDEVRPNDDKTTDRDPIQPSQTHTIRVEVLGDDTLKKVQAKETPDLALCYRIVGEKRLQDITALQQRIRDEINRVPKRKIQVRLVLYLDSPSEGNPDLAPLIAWLRKESVFVPPDKPSKNAEP